jgi:glucarate dehydratase
MQRERLDITRRDWFTLTAAALGGCLSGRSLFASDRAAKDLRIKSVKVTPIALPDPPILAASGCHGPYFLRTILEVVTDDGLVGIGETHGNASVLKDCLEAAALLPGHSAFSIRQLATVLKRFSPAVFAGVEMACLDAVGKATGRRACELLGGPVRDDVEVAAYLFYRYAADDPRVLSDDRLVDARGKGDRALDPWGEVRSAEAMSNLAAAMRDKYGFRVLKLKAGVLEPDEEMKTLELWHERFGNDVPSRIDPNGNWSLETALSIGQQIQRAKLPLEYYEDPVAGQSAMADVRTQTGLKMSTNMCVTRWSHLEAATRTKPIDVLLADLYWFGGISGCQALGRAAESLGWGVGNHSNNHAGIAMAAMIHLSACVPEITYAMDTHYIWLAEGYDVIEGPKLPIQKGRMQIPTAPGLGVQLDRDRLARAHETYQKTTQRSRDDAVTMQRFIPGWKRTRF